ncbi:MAG: AAA family ATPase [Verrucomicrobiota bacterium]|jgi:type II secretory pathway predicted ATPase ExeA|nr:AAA family ATPase [Verrucomicrobiota bacterium]
MYAAYWNLRAIPFLNVVDSRYFFTGDQHEEAVARFTFLAESGRLAGVLTGPYGAGKSTVLKRIADAIQGQNIPVVCMDAIPGGQLPMAKHILEAMQIEDASTSLPDALMSFWRAANAQPNKLVRTLLCIDEAHYLAADNGLYLAHYLTNLRITNPKTQTEEPLFTVIMAGAPELVPALQAEPSLCQRIQITFNLSPLSEEQTTGYVQHHMRAVGGDIWIFDSAALSAIYRYSGGLPRKINLLCDTGLMLGFAAQVPHVNAAIIHQAACDTGLTTLHTHPAAQSPAPQAPAAQPSAPPQAPVATPAQDAPTRIPLPNIPPRA